MTDRSADTALLDAARALDAADPLAAHLDAFVEAPGVTAYLDGNSLGRPLRDVPEKLAAFVREDWGTRLIRSWDEQWMALPMELGDRIGAVALGAGAGQTVVSDSTSVLLYKLMRGALRQAQGPTGAAQGPTGAAQGPTGAAQGPTGAAQGPAGAAQGPTGAAQGPTGAAQGPTAGAAQGPAGRTELVIEEGNFPTDRFLAEGVAAEMGATLRWITPDPVHGVTVDDVAAVVSERTALVSLSHVDYRSGALADMAAITAVVHDAGALMLWDLCHSAGVVPMQLDDWGVDMAVGCTYKYLNGGPGSPAFAYLRHDLQGLLRQPIQGWWSAADIFAMGPEYVPADGIRQLLSGTPPVTSMLAMQGMIDLIEQSGIDGVRAKSESLTALAVRAYDELLAPLDVRLLSPRDPARRGGHITIGHPDFREVTRRLWADGVIPDFRFPDGIRLGLSPLSTSHAETVAGVLAVRDALESGVS
ncbi:kynureninase [Microbacterium sp. UMB0228]|uniref:kynureninase n=1 Tax=Microbacterium sp. UMB0228 TaxID=2029109 RepID=UPI000C80DDF8|nr:aminotransferase class V-fold PLP-dependent enzyme [Microbacterium sp. UMB0228]PMC03878.1 kynureninase [Microbacterium sp. UMB0228]